MGAFVWGVVAVAAVAAGCWFLWGTTRGRAVGHTGARPGTRREGLVTDAGSSILGKQVVRVGDPARWAREDELVARARSALQPADERAALALVDLLIRYGRACEAADARRDPLADEVEGLGRMLCADGGSDRMKLVAYRAQLLGADHPDDTVRDYLSVRQLEYMWDGVCGWQH